MSQARFRKEVTYANRFLDAKHLPEVEQFLCQLLADESSRVVVSEENIIGESKDIFGSNVLYKNASQRLKGFASLAPGFDQVTIWFFIRSIDTFLASMYCEYLRHWPYKEFDTVLNGEYNQSWLPVINGIQNVFPHAQIKIVDYHKYDKILPRVLNEITSLSPTEIPQESKIVRPRISGHTVKAASLLPKNLPFFVRDKSIDLLSTISRLSGRTKPYSPFGTHMRERLLHQYQNDLESIRNSPTLELVE